MFLTLCRNFTEVTRTFDGKIRLDSVQWFINWLNFQTTDNQSELKNQNIVTVQIHSTLTVHQIIGLPVALKPRE